MSWYEEIHQLPLLDAPPEGGGEVRSFHYDSKREGAEEVAWKTLGLFSLWDGLKVEDAIGYHQCQEGGKDVIALYWPIGLKPCEELKATHAAGYYSTAPLDPRQ